MATVTFYLMYYPNHKDVRGTNRYLNVNGRWSSFPSRGVPLLYWDDELSCREASGILLKSRYGIDGELCTLVSTGTLRHPERMVKYDKKLHEAALKSYVK
ncbi:hypothetical protein RA350_004120 [Salmonella enterica]|nr:hypothetical protein [Salmonella enterica]EEC1444776.1 hypothetical protein [Salmonella enterica]ELF6713622.1 hypothetical protein [Salmonella enterica]